jgi:zinc transport system substrate-binding protein
VGDRAEVTLLISDGSDLHSYQPTVADKVRLLNSDLVVYIGGESDDWVCEMLADESGVDLGKRTLCLSEVDGIVLYESRRSSEETHDEGHEHVHTEGDGHDHTFDEHLWLSPSNAEACTRALCERICELDEEGRGIYLENTEIYVGALTQMSAAYAETVASGKTDRLLVADRFPFVYLTEEYGLDFCAAFEGCSTESEASFETVVRLSAQAEAWESRYLIVTEGADKRLAESVIASCRGVTPEILSLHSMQAVSLRSLREGESYLSVMYENLNVLRQALS